MGYADGFYYGQGRIICDTSTFSVGDTIRVRSMTDSSKVWNQQVATVGTALVFTVPCYDYYKICTVQDIGGTPTEIGGVYKTVDYGQTLFIDVIDKSTLAGIQGILNAHQETDLLNIGDEVNIDVSGVATPFLIGAINPYEAHEVVFVAKYTSTNTVTGHTSYSNSNLMNATNGYYTNIGNTDKAFIKEKAVKSGGGQQGNILVTVNQYVWIPTSYEVFGSQGNYVPTVEPANNVHFAIFQTQANRIKSPSPNSSAVNWWTASVSRNGSQYDYYDVRVNSDGSITQNGYTYSERYLPCFHLVADS